MKLLFQYCPHPDFKPKGSQILSLASSLSLSLYQILLTNPLFIGTGAFS